MKKAKNQTCVAELRLSYTPPDEPIVITSACEVVSFMRCIWDQQLIAIQEQFYVVFVNQQHEIITWRCLNTGNGNSTLVDVKLLFASACGCLAFGFVVAHNHPSGSLETSLADKALTNKLKRIGKLMEIPLLDSLIVNMVGSYSIIYKQRID